MKLLVLTSEPISAERLRTALPADVDPTQGEVLIVAPALQDSPLKFWLSDPDDAIARAQEVQRRSVEQLDGTGVSASGDTGESDLMTAIQDALASFSADRILLFASPGEDRYLEDVEPDEVQKRFGIPVTRAQA